jgi:2-keto-3-deoxy-L-rhamnonate aldolase RhmA
MIETPKGVQKVDDIAAAHERVSTIVLGTSDLSRDLRSLHTRYPLCMQPLCTTIIRYTVYCCALWALLPAQQLPQVPCLKDIKVAYKPGYGVVLRH